MIRLQVHTRRGILPLLEDPTGPSRHEFLFAELFAPNLPTGEYKSRMAALRVGRYKLIRSLLDGRE